MAHPDIWHQFELIFDHIDMLDTSLASSQKELHHVLDNLQATLFNGQLLLLDGLSKPLCAGLIHILHCVCTALYALLYVGEIHFLLYNVVNICVSLMQNHLLTFPSKMIHFNSTNFMLTLAIFWTNATSRFSLMQLLAQTQYLCTLHLRWENLDHHSDSVATLISPEALCSNPPRKLSTSVTSQINGF